jgi:hypothetical protein
MRVVYSGGTICSFQTLQRLVLLADEIAFMDRPSVFFGNFGTVGRDSEFRRFQLSDTPVKFSVHAPPSGPAAQLYKSYVEADLRNPQFIRTVIDGLKNDEIFRGRLIAPAANYGWGTGQQVVEALLQDPTLYEGEYGLASDPKLLFVPDTSEGRRQTLSALLLEASIHATNALITAEEAGLSPVSDDPYFCQLLAMRTSQNKYVSQPAPLASMLGLAVAKSVFPDESLSHLNMEDLFAFRRSARDSYAAWAAELDRLSIKLLDVPPEKLHVEAAKIIVSEVRPKMLQLRREMIGARDKLFGDLFKAVSKWEVPTLSLAYVAGLSVPAATAAFASALAPAVPVVVDYFVQRRALVRNNSLAYLVGITKTIDDERA